MVYFRFSVFNNNMIALERKVIKCFTFSHFSL